MQQKARRGMMQMHFVRGEFIDSPEEDILQQLFVQSAAAALGATKS